MGKGADNDDVLHGQIVRLIPFVIVSLDMPKTNLMFDARTLSPLLLRSNLIIEQNNQGSTSTYLVKLITESFGHTRNFLRHTRNLVPRPCYAYLHIWHWFKARNRSRQWAEPYQFGIYI